MPPTAMQCIAYTGKKVMSYFALEDILPGKKMCINHAGEHGQAVEEWFESREILNTKVYS